MRWNVKPPKWVVEQFGLEEFEVDAESTMQASALAAGQISQHGIQIDPFTLDITPAKSHNEGRHFCGACSNRTLDPDECEEEDDACPWCGGDCCPGRCDVEDECDECGYPVDECECDEDIT